MSNFLKITAPLAKADALTFCPRESETTVGRLETISIARRHR